MARPEPSSTSKRLTAETPVGSPTHDPLIEELARKFPLAHRPEQLRERIQTFEDELLKHEQVELDLVQHFCAGVYMRELHIPAGTLLTGKIHKYPCLNIVPVGDIEVVTEGGIKRIQGPVVFRSPAGVKRAARVFSDTIWITVHANPDNTERDSDAMADLLTVPSYESLEHHCPQDALEE